MIKQTAIKVSVTIIILIVIFWLIKRNNQRFRSLFSTSEYIDVIPNKKEQKNKSILIADIESIIKSSESLDKIINSQEEGGRLYEKILLDKALVAQIRNAKDEKEVEKILSEWLNKKGSSGNQTSEGKGTSQKPVQQTDKSKKENNVYKIQKYPKKENYTALQQILAQPKQSTTTQKAGNWTRKSKEVYDEIKNLLESKNFEKLIEIIKTLSDNQIEEILDHYFENFETNKFGAILQKSSSPHDVTNLLKSETIKGLEWEYDRIKENVSIARRKGIDTKHEELLLLSVPQKIKMFQATFDKKDFYKVRDILNEIEKSLKDKEKN